MIQRFAHASGALLVEESGPCEKGALSVCKLFTAGISILVNWIILNWNLFLKDQISANETILECEFCHRDNDLWEERYP